jgi:hypothetical protein
MMHANAVSTPAHLHFQNPLEMGLAHPTFTPPAIAASVAAQRRNKG